MVSFGEENTSAHRRTSQAPGKCFKYQNRIHSKPFAEYLPHQQFSIQKYRLKFLRDCVPLKRPPPTLRISGADAIEQQETLQLFSKLESELLQIAIKTR